MHDIILITCQKHFVLCIYLRRKFLYCHGFAALSFPFHQPVELIVEKFIINTVKTEDFYYGGLQREMVNGDEVAQTVDFRL